MKFFATATVFAATIPLISASPFAAVPAGPVTPTTYQSLDDWCQVVPLSIFPNHTGWEAFFDAAISPNVTASFNYVTYDFNSLKQFFTGVYNTVSTNYEYLRITLVDTVVLKNPSDQGGLCYTTGREVGLKKAAGSQERTERDALFAVVKEIDGERKIVEWRETTNFV